MILFSGIGSTVVGRDGPWDGRMSLKFSMYIKPFIIFILDKKIQLKNRRNGNLNQEQRWTSVIRDLSQLMKNPSLII